MQQYIWSATDPVSGTVLLHGPTKLGWGQLLSKLSTMPHLLEKKIAYMCYYCLFIALFAILDCKLLESMNDTSSSFLEGNLYVSLS